MRGLVRVNLKLAEGRGELLQQYHALVVDRDELVGRLEELSTDLDAALELVRVQKQSPERLQRLQDAVMSVKEALDQETRRIRSEPQPESKLLTRVLGDCGSPIVNPADPYVFLACSRVGRWTQENAPGVALDEEGMLSWFHRLSRHYSRLPFTPQKTTKNRYYYDNPQFSFGDAITLFCTLCELKPKRLVEIGSGFSSCVSMDTNDQCLGGSVELTFIDPNPERLLALLDKEDPYHSRIQASCVQDVPTRFFASLEKDDILFIDGSHVAKTGSDVNDCFFRVLPALRPGVVVHFHDIHYPFEYPIRWVLEHNRSWNEAYLLHAFLQYNDAFDVIYFNNFIYSKHRKLTERLMPLCLSNAGGSIWLRRMR